MHTLTARNFATFKRAVERYLVKFNLSGWHVEVHHEASAGAMAEVSVQPEAHRADVYLAPQWDETPTREKLYAKAKHEVLHILMGKLAELANKRYATQTDLTEAEEELVIRLMVLLPNL